MKCNYRGDNFILRARFDGVLTVSMKATEGND